MAGPAPLLTILLVAAAAMPAATASAAAPEDPLIVDLSKSEVSITTSFVGSDLLLFGTTAGQGDVIVVVRGPRRDETVRRKERVAGIWVNRSRTVFELVPDFYAVAASKPLLELLPAKTLAAHQIGVKNIDLEQRWPLVGKDELDDFRIGFIRNKQRQGLYAEKTGEIHFLGNRLFRTRLHFPANVSTGIYTVEVFLVHGRRIISTESTVLSIFKFGVEAQIFNFAHRHALGYGVLAILIAAVAGWFGNIVFRQA